MEDSFILFGCVIEVATQDEELEYLSDDASDTTHREEPEEEEPEFPEGADEFVEESRRKRHERRASGRGKGNATFASFLVWAAFVILWLFFFASGFGIFENIAVALSSFILVGGILGAIWTPSDAGPEGAGWRINISIMSGVIWLAFIILWLPFWMESYTLYQNLAVLLGSTLLLILVNSSSWVGVAPTMAVMKSRNVAGSVVFLVWIVLSIYWLWFEAGGYVWEQNFALGVLSLLIVLIVETAIFRSSIEVSPDIVSPYVPVGLLFAWLATLFVWFWFFGEPFTGYQNIAVFFASMLLYAGIGYLYAMRRRDTVEDLAWEE